MFDFRTLFGHMRRHIGATVVVLFVSVIVLGGLVWKVIGLVRKVPVAGNAVADAATKVARATGSA